MTIAFIGMGEAGAAIVGGWAGGAGPIRAYDVKTRDPAAAAAMRARYARLGVEGAEDAPAAVTGAAMVFSAVTADQAVEAARAAAPGLAAGAFWFDLNSCAPASKRAAAAVIEGAGGRYVDVAVMAPIHPRRHMTPLLIAGPHAAAAEAALAALPMAPRRVEGPVGAASSIKMIRSVMVKGLEALTAECALAAIRAGVEDEVFASLLKSHPGTDWPAQTAYNLERSLAHGARRAAEMEEVAKTLEDLGLPADMARATVGWQARLAATGAAPPGPGEAELRRAAGEITARIARNGRADAGGSG